MKLPLGLIQWTEGTDGEKLVEYVRRLESLGYEELWLPEIAGREPFSTAGYLLAKTDKIKISSGIANVYARDADASAQAANTLNEFSNGRFSLGLGVSHPLLVEPRGHEWVPPVKKMNSYLKRLLSAPLQSPLASKPSRPSLLMPGYFTGTCERSAGSMNLYEDSTNFGVSIELIEIENLDTLLTEPWKWLLSTYFPAQETTDAGRKRVIQNVFHEQHIGGEH